MNFTLSITIPYTRDYREAEKFRSMGFDSKLIKNPKTEHLYEITNRPAVEINSLGGLLDFQNKFGKIIIGKRDDIGYTIEIYNGYRE